MLVFATAPRKLQVSTPRVVCTNSKHSPLRVVTLSLIQLPLVSPGPLS